jgi:hypothetical protein
MAYYYSFRGWLEVEPENFSRVIEAVRLQQASHAKNSKLALYSQGWCWSETPINWTRYLFYGADLTKEGLDFFQKLLEGITGMGLNVSGYFHAQGEDGEENIVYKIVDDMLYVEEDVPAVEIT